MANPKKIGVSIGGVIILALAVIAFAVAPMMETNSGAGLIVLGKWGSRTIDNGPDSPFIEQYNLLDRYIDKSNIRAENEQQREIIANQIAYIAFRAALSNIVSGVLMSPTIIVWESKSLCR